MDNGYLQQVGTPNEVYNEPENKFVARFIGSPSMNIFTGTIERSEVTTPLFEFSLEDGPDHGYQGPGKIGIRPDDVEIHEDESDGLFRAPVRVIEELGSENLVHLDLDSDVEGEFIARVDERVRPKTGDLVGVSFPEEAVYLFDGDDKAVKHRQMR
jgi:multiple sugar transport system ATP-binding protein